MKKRAEVAQSEYNRIKEIHEKTAQKIVDEEPNDHDLEIMKLAAKLLDGTTKINESAVLRERIKQQRQLSLNQELENRPLHNYAIKGDVSSIQALIKSGVALDSRDSVGWSPLHYAAQLGHHDIVKALLQAGANPNISDNNNRTPLHYAANKGHHACIQALVDAGAALDVKDAGGLLPRDFAAMNRHSTIAQALTPGGGPRDIFDKWYGSSNPSRAAENTRPYPDSRGCDGSRNGSSNPSRSAENTRPYPDSRGCDGSRNGDKYLR